MRIFKEEIMTSKEEATAYDLVVSKYLDIVHAGFAESVINFSPAQGKFLEIGTGPGWDSILIAKNTQNIQITAIDLSDEMLKTASQNALSQGVRNKINFIKADAKALPFEDNSFDAVFSHHMLHHLSQPQKMLAEITRVVKSDGAIMIRDLIRHSKWMNVLCVEVLGFNYDKAMKAEYRKSILAAYSKEEWMDLKDEMNVPNLRLAQHCMTHISMVRPSLRRRTDYIKVINPFLRRMVASFYISKP